jgi:hypothetical protein
LQYDHLWDETIRIHQRRFELVDGKLWRHRQTVAASRANHVPAVGKNAFVRMHQNAIFGPIDRARNAVRRVKALVFVGFGENQASPDSPVVIG